MRTMVETVQNAIDANAQKVFIGVDQHAKTVIVADDGDGVTIPEFDLALNTIAESRKDPGSDKIGKFGIGVISPLTKCEYFEFISWKRQQGARPNLWHFELKQLKDQRSDGIIPRQPLEAMPSIQDPFARHAGELGHDWRTMVRMFGVTDDKVISKIELTELEYLIQSSLGDSLRRKNVMCRVVLRNERQKITWRDIKPREFTGEPLGTFSITDPLAGDIRIELYRARPQGRGNVREGVVGVTEMHKVSTVPWNRVAQHAKTLDNGTWAESEIFTVFGSGYFEGTVYCEKIKLLADRDKFKGNDALKGLIIGLDTWYQETGKALYQEEHDRQIDKRYQEISHRAMQRVQDRVLKNELFRGIQDSIQRRLNIGHVDGSHADPTKSIGQDEQNSLRASGETPEKQEPKKTPDAKKESADKKGGSDKDVPTGATGPRGRRRTQVQNDSLGIWFTVTDFEFNPQLWSFNLETGELAFNSNHHIWMELDGSLAKQRTARHDRHIEMLQVWVAMKVLWLLTQPEGQFETGCDQVNDELSLFVEVFIKPSP